MALTRPILNGKLKIAKVRKEDTPSLLNQRVAKITANDGFFRLLIFCTFKKVNRYENRKCYSWY